MKEETRSMSAPPWQFAFAETSSGHSLRDPAHQSQDEEIEKNRQLQGLRY